MSTIDTEVGPKGFDPYNSADRDPTSSLEWQWILYTPGERPLLVPPGCVRVNHCEEEVWQITASTTKEGL